MTRSRLSRRPGPSLPVLLLALLVAAAGLAPVGSATAATTPLTVTADEIVSDAATGIVTAAGNVSISDGETVATGQRLRLDTRGGRAVLTPAAIRGPQGTLRASEVAIRFTQRRITQLVARGAARAALRRGSLAADEIIMTPGTNRLAAAGHVVVKAPPDITATGTRLTYLQGPGTFTMAGPVRIRTTQGTARGARLDGNEGLQRATLSGGVVATVGGVSATAERGTLVVPERKLVLEGAVRVRQGARVLRAARVTVFYETRRVIAEGMTNLQIPDGPPEPDVRP